MKAPYFCVFEFDGKHVDSIVLDEGSATVLSQNIQKNEIVATREHALCPHAVEVATIIC